MFKLVTALVAAFVVAGCSSKKKNDDHPTDQEPTHTIDAATDALASEGPPWRVKFSVDDNPSNSYIPRPNDQGLAITTFITRRAKDTTTWKRVELGLADGTQQAVEDPSRTHPGSQFMLRKREPAGVDFVIEPDGGGEPTLVVGPLSWLRVRTSLPTDDVARVDGRAVLVIRVGGETHTIPPSVLDDVAKAEGTGDRKGWSLATLVAMKARLPMVAEVVVHAINGKQVVSGDALRGDDWHYLIRHNRRGDLRLEVTHGDDEKSDLGLRSVQRIEVTLAR